MTTYFVDSTKTAGADTGGDWTDAFLSMARDWGALAADPLVYVRSIHAESDPAAKSITGTSAEGSAATTKIYSVLGAATGTTPGALTRGASVTCTGTTNDLRIHEKIYINGVDFVTEDDFNLGTGSGSDHYVTLEDCSITLTGTSGADVIAIGQGSGIAQAFKLVDTDITFGNVAQGFNINACKFYWNGGSLLTNNVTNLFELANLSRPYWARVENVDLSVLTGSVIHAANQAVIFDLHLSRCEMGTGSAFVNGALDIPGSLVRASNCQIGTDADPSFQLYQHTYEGTVEATSASYRTSGASDDERTNPISWDMSTVAGSQREWPSNALESPAITGWTDGDGSTSHTYRIYIASGGTQQDDDVWFDLITPNEDSTSSQGLRSTTRLPPEGTAANLTTDAASTWTGADVGTKQYMSITVTPDKPGPISARVYMASDAGTAAGHVFVDPKIYIDV